MGSIGDGRSERDCRDTGTLVIVLTLVMILAFVTMPSGANCSVDSSAGHRPAFPRLEYPGDPPGVPARPVPGAPRGEPVRFGRFSSIQVNVDSNGANIPGDAANEPSIAIDPTSPNRMAIGWRQFDTIASDFREAGYAWSADSGRTWTFEGVLEPMSFAATRSWTSTPRATSITTAWTMGRMGR
jgi:hypothetical protein